LQRLGIDQQQSEGARKKSDEADIFRRKRSKKEKPVPCGAVS